MRRALVLAIFTIMLVTACGGSAGKSKAQVVACLKREGLVTRPPLSALVNPTGLRYELDVGVAPGQPPGPGLPEDVIDMFQSSDQAAQYATGGEDRRGPAVITTTAHPTRAQVRMLEACAF
jgi:hypothetical protein